MIKTNNFYINTNAQKNTTFETLPLVKSIVRNKELAVLLDKKAFKDGKKTIEDAHADEVDVFTCDESIIQHALGNDAGAFIKLRDEAVSLQAEIDTLPGLDEVTSLCPTDRVHLTLMAHAIYKNVVLDNDIFEGVDLQKPIQDYYRNGSFKQLKDTLRVVFNRLVGTEGDNFYAIKTKRSDFTEKDLRNFLASFGGSAKRDKEKKKVDGQEVVTFKNYDYTDKSGNRKLQVSAFTTLCAVVLDNASKHDVIKPEAEEKKEETK